MGTLFDICRRVSLELEARHSNDAMGLLRAKGEIASRAGFLVALVGPNDPDDPEKVRKLSAAARELGIEL